MDNIRWLFDHGGASIKLRMMKEGLINKDTFDVNELADELLQIEKVQTVLSYFDQFKHFRTMPDKELWALVHNCNENCFEMFMSFLIRIGFRKGISILDEKVEIMRDVYKYLMEIYDFHGLNIIGLLLNAGYIFNDMEEYIAQKVDKCHKITEINAFDFYETDINNIRQPKRWKDFLIVKDKYNPHGNEYPLPTNYDIDLFLAFYQVTENEALKRKIDDIMRFIMHPEYQKTKGDNGWHWSGKTYHASSAGWELPMFFENEYDLAENQNWSFINKLQTNSLSQVIASSEYLNKCICYLEQYRTERGTYMFPEKLMFSTLVKPLNISLACDVFVSKDISTILKRSNKKAFIFEVYSTFIMAVLRNRMNYNK